MSNFNLMELENSLNYEFKNTSLLKTALTHSSYANENKLKIQNSNERLEFLGDTILNLVVSLYLYKKYPAYSEGELTKIRAKVVCEYSLAYAAKKINLGKYLFLGKGEEATGGRVRDSILADTAEAIVGAIYLDSGFKNTNDILIKNFEKDIVKAVAKGDLFTDYKTKLQEILQADSKYKISYIVEDEKGPDHRKVFYINVYFKEEMLGSGIGKNKKESEQMAAKNALIKMGVINE